MPPSSADRRVQSLRYHWHIPCHQPSDHEPEGELLNVTAAARQLDIASSTLLRWLNDGCPYGRIRAKSMSGWRSLGMPHIIHPSRATDWVIQTSRGSHDEVYWSRRLMVARIFARHLAAMDPATEVPPEDMMPHHYRRIA